MAAAQATRRWCASHKIDQQTESGNEGKQRHALGCTKSKLQNAVYCVLPALTSLMKKRWTGVRESVTCVHSRKYTSICTATLEAIVCAVEQAMSNMKLKNQSEQQQKLFCHHSWCLWRTLVLTEKESYCTSFVYYVHFTIPFGKLGSPYNSRKCSTRCRVLQVSACWVFSCFRNPPNSDMDYSIFNVPTWSFLCVRIHMGVGHADSESAQHFWLGKTLRQRQHT